MAQNIDVKSLIEMKPNVKRKTNFTAVSVTSFFSIYRGFRR